MSVMRCGPLAAWSNAFFAGRVSIDQVADAVVGSDGQHHVLGLPDVGSEPAPLRDLLVALRRGGGGVRVVLPASGDPRGLPGPDRFRAAALDCGEAVIGAGLGAVPDVIDHAPSSAPPTVIWQVHRITEVPVDHLALGDAQYDLTTAIRESAGALARADVAGAKDGVDDSLSAARRAGERLNLPPGFPSRAVALLAQAERLQAVLDLARADPIGGAIETTGIAARWAALRPLATAVRRARAAAYNAEARG